MNAIPKRSDPAFWVESKAAETAILRDKFNLDPSQDVLTKIGRAAQKTTSNRLEFHSITLLTLVILLLKHERVISYFLLVILAVCLAVISASATSAGISVRDSKLAVEKMKGEISLMRTEVERLKRSTASQTLIQDHKLDPIEHDDVIWIPSFKMK